MFTNLETKRLFLKCIDHIDRDFIFEEFQNEFINRYLFDAEPMTVISEADELIDFYTVTEPRNQNRWILIDKQSNKKLGTCGFHFWYPDKKEVEIGFELMEQYTGKGYMQEAVKTLIEFAQNNMLVSKINAIVYIYNKKCIALLEKFKFVKVGEEGTEFRSQIYPHFIYALQI